MFIRGGRELLLQEAENTLADIGVAKKLLNFNPKTDVKDWIKNVISK